MNLQSPPEWNAPALMQTAKVAGNSKALTDNPARQRVNIEYPDDPTQFYTSMDDEYGGPISQCNESLHQPRRIPPSSKPATPPQQLAEEIRKTLLHELGHHTGMNGDQLNHLGYGPLEDDETDNIQWDLDDDNHPNS